MLDSSMLLQHNLQTNVLSFDYCLNAIPKWDAFLDSVQTLPSFTAPSGPPTHRLIYTSTGLFGFSEAYLWPITCFEGDLKILKMSYIV